MHNSAKVALGNFATLQSCLTTLTKSAKTL
jgi:hypothetical protein